MVGVAVMTADPVSLLKPFTGESPLTRHELAVPAVVLFSQVEFLLLLRSNSGGPCRLLPVEDVDAQLEIPPRPVRELSEYTVTVVGCHSSYPKSLRVRSSPLSSTLAYSGAKSKPL